MTELELNHLVLRYCRQIIMKMMDHVRSTMRGENRLHLKFAVTDPRLQKPTTTPRFTPSSSL